VSSHLWISIAPVQAFVAQSRRTRDLWSSSYLLSFLAAHALCGARKAGGKVVRPLVENDPMLQWVDGCGSGEPPRYGSLPNQFTVELPQGTEPKSVAEAAKRAFDDAWRRICKAVWGKFVAHAADRGERTCEIWERQVNGFWEFVWVAGDPKDDGLLARRKLWRTHWLPEECGDKCTLMPDFQELSGYVRATRRTHQDQFWQEIRNSLGGLELQDQKERLCAIALIKRLWPRSEIVCEALGRPVDVQHWPSTVDVAAVSWARTVMDKRPIDAKNFATAVVREAGQVALTGGVRDLLDHADSTNSFARLDANWFHQSFIQKDTSLPLDENARERLLAQLRQLSEDTGGPPIYFAMLLADGDRLGRLIGSGGAADVSKALARFTCAAPRIIRRHHGATIYAGGDDLLAMLPVEGALQCAHEVEQAYRCSFEQILGGRPPNEVTLSAAVVFAHARAPLSLILAEAHRVLDAVAKKENGRNSLGVSVLRAPQCAAQWVSTWHRADPEGTEYSAVECVANVANALREGKLSAAFSHRIGRTLVSLCGLSPSPGSFSELPGGFELAPFLRGELEQSAERQTNAADPDKMAQMLDRLLRRSRCGEGLSTHIGLDGLVLARFVAGGGREEEHWTGGE
jgi:CRISPR-associated protein Cmr2